MEKRNTFSQLLYVKKHRVNANNEVPIYLRITINGQQTEMATHRFVDLNLWDIKKSCVVGNNKLAKDINADLFSIKTSIYEHFKLLREKEIELTPIAIKNSYLGIKEKEKGLIDVYKEHNDNIEKLVNIDFSPITVQRYRNSLNKTRDFIKIHYKKDDLPLLNLNYDFLINYEVYIKTYCKCSHNSAMRYIKNLRKIVRIALANDWIQKDPFSNYKMKLKKVDRDYLTDEELDILLNKQFKFERLEQVKDCFLFSCFTGLAHSDLKRLTPQHIVKGNDGNLWVKINRKKTDVASNIPLLPATARIIEKYKTNPFCITKNVLLPVLSNQKMNAYLKEIADLCGIEKNLTSHIARHTFATTVTLNNDVPIESVSKMLGHSSINMTKIYARLLDKKVGRDMQHLYSKFA